MSDANTTDRGASATATSRLEWAAAAFGALLLASLVGYLAYLGLTAPTGPPRIVLTTGAVERASGGFTLPFTARNDGRSTAAAVKVTGKLLAGDRILEESEAVLDYVPDRSEREGRLFFDHDPRQHNLMVKAEGDTKP